MRVEVEITRLQAIHAITQHIASLASNAASQTASDPLEPFEGDFSRLLEDFRAEYDEYDLDEVIVGAIAQVVGHGLPSGRKSKLTCPIARALVPRFRAPGTVRCLAEGTAEMETGLPVLRVRSDADDCRGSLRSDSVAERERTGWVCVAGNRGRSMADSHSIVET